VWNLITKSDIENEVCDSEPVDYTVRILHVRPEVGKDTEFLLSYNAKESRGKRFIEEMFSQAFKTAHPKWIIKKVTVEEKL
jgi:hypothetical protein